MMGGKLSSERLKFEREGWAQMVGFGMRWEDRITKEGKEKMELD